MRPGGASGRGKWWYLAGLLGATGLTMACRAALGTVLDLPPPSPQAATTPVRGGEAVAPSPRSGWAALQGLLGAEGDSARPDIERTLDPDSAIARLPRDHAGNIDWQAALRDSVIRPRRTRPGVPSLPAPLGFQFGFDFNFRGPDTTFDARFPHSTHTEWLACKQCHDRIFPYRDTKVTMAEIFQGKFCAECHGKVAFPVLTGCERCHTRLPMKADRAKPLLLGTVQLHRDTAQTAAKGASLGGGLPRAVFPHWVHRIRYRCSACHMDLFEPRAGTNRITMEQISAGQACGVCHNGDVAFRPDIASCSRCHVPPVGPPPLPATG